MAEQVRVPKGVSADAYLNAVRCVFDAMHQLMTTGTSTPGADFFNAVHRVRLRCPQPAVAAPHSPWLARPP